MLVAEENAAAGFLPLVYDQLRRPAVARLAGERNEHTLQPTGRNNGTGRVLTFRLQSR